MFRINRNGYRMHKSSSFILETLVIRKRNLGLQVARYCVEHRADRTGIRRRGAISFIWDEYGRPPSHPKHTHTRFNIYIFPFAAGDYTEGLVHARYTFYIWVAHTAL